MTAVQITPESIPVPSDPTTPVRLEDTPPEKLTLRQIKELRRKYLTVRHPRVVGCGHRLDLSRVPRQEKCPTCWFAFFNNHGELTKGIHDMFVTQGPDAIRQTHGKRFLKQFIIFMVSINELQKRVKESAEQSVADVSAIAEAAGVA